VDEVDRLRPEEIRDLMRLVRLVADFPNTTYVLALDRGRVEDALGDGDAKRGRAALDKMLQATQDLPVVPDDLRGALLTDEIDKLVLNRTLGPFQTDRWPDVFLGVIRPLLRNMRDVRRYLASLDITLAAIGDEVALVDVLALEAVRIASPTVYESLHDAVASLTFVDRALDTTPADPALEIRFNALLALDPDQTKVLREFFRLIFPATQRYLSNTHYGSDWMGRWRRDRRVAHPDVFRFALERRLAPGAFPASRSQGLFDVLSDRSQLIGELAAVTPEEFEAAMSTLEDFEDKFTEAQAAAAIPVLLDRGQALPQGTTHMFDFDASLRVERIVLRLARAIPEERRDEVLQEVLDATSSLTGKSQLIAVIGHRANVGSQLVSKERAEAMESSLRAAVIIAGSDALAQERNALTLLRVATEAPGADGLVRAVLASDVALAGMLRSCLSEAYSGALGSHAARRELRLPWDVLEALFGKELSARVVALAASPYAKQASGREAEAINVAVRYAQGWRPQGP
jgi:predicted KAP-like P-loop ATPase